MERPKCANKKCDERAIIMYGQKFYCGTCATKIQVKMGELRERQIERILEED